MIDQDTPFNDLPQSLKQKIIHIRNLSTPQQTQTVPIPLKGPGEYPIPSAKYLHETALKLLASIQNLRPTNVEASFKQELAEFKRFVEAYRTSINETDFIAEMDKMIQLLESRFKKLR
ncbi:hypothetical protein PAEPH01_2045 [Pancytospora epiphaga]|nr:hypothetical protein PAEPH01_2045 [Pancytospora epiphaga]